MKNRQIITLKIDTKKKIKYYLLSHFIQIFVLLHTNTLYKNY